MSEELLGAAKQRGLQPNTVGWMWACGGVAGITMATAGAKRTARLVGFTKQFGRLINVDGC